MRLLTRVELKPLKGIHYSSTHLTRLINAGEFPKPVQLSPGRIAFVETEVDEWIKRRIAERDAGPRAGRKTA